MKKTHPIHFLTSLATRLSRRRLQRPAFPVARTRRVATGLLLGLALPLARGAADSSGGAAPTYADLSLEQLMDLKVARVYGASKYEQKITQAPSSVTIVSSDEIRQFGWRTIADMLRSVRGFYSFDDRNYAYVGVRGFMRPGDYNTRMLILIDGHRQNDNIYDGGYVGREMMVSADLIERVEVIRGPSSSVYGSSAFFGVINVVTKKPASSGGRITTEVGDNRTFETQLTFNHAFKNGVEWVISGANYTSEGEARLYFPTFDQRVSDEPRAANDGVAVDSDGERSRHLFTSLRYRDFTLSAFVSSRHKDVPTAAFGTAFAQRGFRTDDRRGYLDAKFDRAVGEHRLLGRVFYDQYRYNGDYPYDYAEPGDAPDVQLGFDGAVGEWVGTEWQFNARVSPKHALIVGTEFRDNFREDQFSVYTGTPPLDDQRRSRTLGLFAQWEASLLKNLRLSLGGRYDYYYGSFGDTFNPRLGIIYNVSEGATIKALYGEAFRAPNPYERYYYYQQWSLPPLRPERIRTQELVFERYWGRTYRANLSLYHYHIDGLISQRSTEMGSLGNLYFENIDATHAYGSELELEAKYASGWLVRGSYAWQHTEDRSTQQWLTSSPRALAKLNLGWSPANAWLSAGFELQYQSSSRTLTDGRTDDFVLAHLHLLSAKLVRNVEVSLTAANLFDTRYSIPGAEDHAQDAIEQPRRQLRLKVTRRF